MCTMITKQVMTNVNANSFSLVFIRMTASISYYIESKHIASALIHKFKEDFINKHDMKIQQLFIRLSTCILCTLCYILFLFFSASGCCTLSTNKDTNNNNNNNNNNNKQVDIKLT
jgi:hypothetical protein